MKKKPDYSCKIVLVGNSSVGKSNIIHRICKDEFHMMTTTTVGFDIMKKYIRTQQNQTIQLCFWDTAGQQKYRNLTKCYFKSSDAIIYVYSINNKQSFQDLAFWVKEAQEICGNNNVIEVILCNKIDLDEEQYEVERSYGVRIRDKLNKERKQKRRRMSKNKGNKLKQEGKDIEYFEVSAKNGQNIDIFLNHLASHLREKKYQEDPLGNRPIYLSDTESKRESFVQNQNKRCC